MGQAIEAATLVPPSRSCAPASLASDSVIDALIERIRRVDLRERVQVWVRHYKRRNSSRGKRTLVRETPLRFMLAILLNAHAR